jgi:predicted RNA methylase
MKANLSDVDWEALWSPYDLSTYHAVLEMIQPNDVVFDIGAGDLRLARQMLEHAKKIYAVEINRRVLSSGMNQSFPDSHCLVPICADARSVEIPSDVSVGVLLMRHCQNFRLYAQRLKQAGIDRLITNARWRMGVECVRLQIERIAYEAVRIGWFACWCGAVGFKPGPAENYTSNLDYLVHEVSECPSCTT